MRPGWRAIWIVLAALLGMTLAFGVHRLLKGREDELGAAEFTQTAQAIIQAIDLEFATALETVESLRSSFAGSEYVDRGEFAAFAERPLQLHPEIRSFTWAERVAGADRATHEARVRDEGFPGYAMWDAGEGRVAAAARAEHYPTVYVEPRTLIPDLLGLDWASEPVRRDALGRALSAGTLAAGAPSSLKGESVSILVAGPANSKKQEGIVAARIMLDAVVSAALRRFGEKERRIGIFITDGAQLVYGTRTSSALERQGRIGVADGYLDVHCRAGSGYARHTWAPLATLLSLLLATALAVGYFGVLSVRTARTERLVEERTATIREVTRVQRAILDSASYAILAFDAEGRILTFNPAAERMLGYPSGEVIGRLALRDFEERAAPGARPAADDAGSGLRALVALAERGGAEDRTWRRKDGSSFPARLSVSKLHAESGEIAGFLAIAHDITDQLAAEGELREAKAQAEEASRTKSRFLANMSHELRTPLNAILGYSEMLEEDATAAGRAQDASDLLRIQTAGRHLLRLIDDVLDLSKVEAGRIDLRVEQVAIREVVEEVAATVRGLAAARGNEIVLSCAPSLALHTDPTRLRQVLLNLVANAARFTENGRLEIEVEQEAAGGETRFRVRDTGIGISREDLGRIFEPFAQGDSSTTRKYGGTGLGLAICKQFTELMGGTLEATSELGKGSEFVVRLPGSGGHGRSVLVIDDDPNVRDLLERILGRHGYRVASAPDGRSGLELARKDPPSAIVLDVVMPEMDGWSVLAELKRDADLAPIPVVVQTVLKDRTTGFALGAAEYVEKPLDVARLLGALERQARRARPAVLVVEDDEETRRMIVRALERARCTVTAATEGRAALDALSKARPDVVLLDLMMPGMDGFDLLDRMRARDDWRRIPVIVLTARQLDTEERLRLAERAARVLHKGAAGAGLQDVCRIVRELGEREGVRP